MNLKTESIEDFYYFLHSVSYFISQSSKRYPVFKKKDFVFNLLRILFIEIFVWLKN